LIKLGDHNTAHRTNRTNPNSAVLVSGLDKLGDRNSRDGLETCQLKITSLHVRPSRLRLGLLLRRLPAVADPSTA
jgi:hypothetical protein